MSFPKIFFFQVSGPYIEDNDIFLNCSGLIKGLEALARCLNEQLLRLLRSRQSRRLLGLDNLRQLLVPGKGMNSRISKAGLEKKPFHAIFLAATRHRLADTFPPFWSLAVISLQGLQYLNSNIGKAVFLCEEKIQD